MVNECLYKAVEDKFAAAVLVGIKAVAVTGEV
jgi:hypothetical protein